MSESQGCNDDKEVIDRFTEALQMRVGKERFQVWFSGVEFELERDGVDSENRIDENGQALASQAATLLVIASAQFISDRLTKDYLSSIRGAAASVCGRSVPVRVTVRTKPARQVELPFAETSDVASSSDVDESLERNARGQSGSGRSPERTQPKRAPVKSTGTISLGSILNNGLDSRSKSTKRSQPVPSTRDAKRDSNGGSDTAENHPIENGSLWQRFVGSASNQLALTACRMAIQDPKTASPLVLWGPPGSGKTHLLNGVAAELRRVHRMRHVRYLAAEEFTNDFLRALHSNCLPAFRTKFRDLDALIIDDIQFFSDKKATTRELHRTVEMLIESGKPLLFAGAKSPNEMSGLGSELSGRLSSGLVCQVQSLDTQARIDLLKQYATSRCDFAWPTSTVEEIAELIDGDGRVLAGVVNLVSLLQKMYSAMPTMDQIRQHGSHLLRAAGVPITLSAIERAVERVFQLDSQSLQSESQTKTVTEPRMLAMYLSRQHTSCAFSEIGGHFGGRSHSTAILANQRVQQWLDAEKPIGRGRSAISAGEAIRRVEAVLKAG